MSSLKKLAGQTAVYGLSSIVGRLLNYLLVPLYTRVLLTDQYGIVNELYAYASFLMVLLTYGLETGFFRFVQKEENANKVYTTGLISLLISSAVFIFLVIIFIDPIAGLLDYTANKEFIVWFAFIAGFDAVTALPFARLRQLNKPLRFATIRLINIGLSIFLNLFFLVFCRKMTENNPESVFNHIYSPNLGVVYIFISNLIASAVTFLIFIPDLIKIKIIFDKKLLLEMLKYSLPLVIVGLAGMVNETLDRILQKHFIVAPENITAPKQYIMAQIGIYGANFKIAILMTLFIQTFRYAAEPFFFAHGKENSSRKIYADVMLYFVLFCLLIFVGVMMYIDIVKYFIGADYREGLKVVPLLLLSHLFLGVIFNLSFWYKITGKTMLGAWVTVFGAIITILFNIIFLPVMGYMASAWASFICYFLMMLVSYFLGQKYFKVDYNLKRMGGYFVLSLALYMVSELAKPENLYIRLVLNTILLLTFCIVVYKTEKLHRLKNEFKTILQKIKTKKIS